MRKLFNRKSKIALLALLLVVSIVCIGTVIGKYVKDADVGTFDLSWKAKPQEYILKTGDEFNAAIKGLNSEASITNIVIGTFSDHADAQNFTWENGTEVGVNTDTLRAFSVETDGEYGTESTVYVLSKENRTIYTNPDASYMFSDLDSLTGITGLDKLNTERTTDMNNMFYGHSVLTSLDVSSFDVSNVVNMRGMFEGDPWSSALTSLNMSGWDSSSVMDMSRMFYGCGALTSLSVSDLDTENVVNMTYMFAECSALSGLDVSAFNTSDVATMSGMFMNCTALTSLDLSAFDTSAVGDTSKIDSDEAAYLLEYPDYPDAGYAALDMSSMFSGCKALTTLDVSSFNTKNVRSMQSMFGGCEALTTLDISSFETCDVVTDEDMGDNKLYIYGMFRNCSALTTIYADGTKWDVDEVGQATHVFTGSTNIVGGQGTKQTDFDYTTSDSDYVYAQVDRANETDGGKGLFTDINQPKELTLTTGTKFNAALKAILEEDGNENVNKVHFGTFNDYGTDLTWNDGVDVSAENNGSIRAFAVDTDSDGSTDSVYVLSERNGKLYANADCKSMFQHDSGGENMHIPAGRLTSITGLNALDTSRVTTMENMFFRCSGLTELDVSEFNTALVTDMSFMFRYCSGLSSLDVSNFDTEKVTTMEAMFEGCSGLTELDVSRFDTELVDDMRYMFEGCSSLTNLDVSGFNTARVTNISGMFKGCSGLTKLDVSNFDTEKVIYMSSMFDGCSSLTDLDVSGFDTALVTDISGMFKGCSGLTKLDVSNFDTEKVIYMSSMFNGCGGLTELDVSNFTTANVIYISSMFDGCSGLTELDLSNFDTAKVTTMESMFDGCASLKTISVTDKWNTDAVTTSTNMFRDCTSIVGVSGTVYDSAHTDVAYAHIDEGVTNPGYLTGELPSATLVSGTSFNSKLNTVLGVAGNESVVKVHFGTLNDAVESDNSLLDLWNASTTYMDADDTGSIRTVVSGDTVYVLSQGSRQIYANTDSKYMFRHNYTATSGTAVTGYLPEGRLQVIAGLDNVDMSRVTDMNGMFFYCTGLTQLDVSSFNTESVTDMYGMFLSCPGLTQLDVSSFDTKNVTTMQYMFRGCSNLTSLDVSGFDTAKVTNLYGMFSGCTKLASVDVSGFNAKPTGTYLDYMFYNCESLTTIDLSGVDTSALTNLRNVFDGCSSLTSLDISGWNTENVTAMNSLFNECSSLPSLDLSEFDTSKVTYMAYMFYECRALTNLDLTGFDTALVYNMDRMFGNCISLRTVIVDEDSWSTEAVTSSTSMFVGCTSIKGWLGTTYDSSHIDKEYARIDGGSAAPGYLTAISSMPQGYIFTNALYNDNQLISSVTKLTIDYWSTDYETKFGDWTSGTQFRGSDIRYFVDGTELYILSRGLIVANADSDGLFSEFNSVKSIEGLDKIDVSGVESLNGLFMRCYALESVDLSSWDTANVTDMSSLFNDCTALQSVDLSGLSTAKVKNMTGMFNGCTALTEVDLSSFTTANVTSLSSMFYDCTNLTTIYASTWDLSNVTDDFAIFENCTKLSGGAGTVYTADYDYTYCRVDGGTSAPGFFTDPAQKTGSTSLDTDGLENADAELQSVQSYGEAGGTTYAISLTPHEGYALPDSLLLLVGATEYTVYTTPDELAEEGQMSVKDNPDTILFDAETSTIYISDGIVPGTGCVISVVGVAEPVPEDAADENAEDTTGENAEDTTGENADGGETSAGESESPAEDGTSSDDGASESSAADGASAGAETAALPNTQTKDESESDGEAEPDANDPGTEE